MGHMKKAYTVFFCSILASLALLTGCSSENNNGKRVYADSVGVAKSQDAAPAENAASSAETASSEGKQDAATLKIAAANVVKNESGAVLYNPNEKYGSLWESDLFNDSRFKLKIKLSASEKKEAKILARSFESHMERGKYFMHYLLSELKARNPPGSLRAAPVRALVLL